MAEREEEHGVGYGRPPKKQHQFQKGVSGNARWSPKGSKNISQIVELVCREHVTVKGQNGQTIRMGNLQAVMMQLLNQALRGELKATRTCLRMLPPT